MIKDSICDFNLVGAYGSKNIGDDFLLKITYDFLVSNFREIKIKIHTKDSSYISLLCPNAQILDFTSKKNAKIIIYGGGTQFFSFNSDQKLKMLIKHIIKYRFPAIKLPKGTPFFLGIGIGPFVVKSEPYISTRFLLKRAKKVWVRDYKSLSLAENWKLKNNLILGTDLCFSDIFINKYILPNKVKNKSKKIAIIHRYWQWGKEGKLYTSAIKKLLPKLKKKGVEIEFLILHQSDIKNTADMNIFDSPVHLWNPADDIDDFLRRIASYSVIISSRYHGIILGSLLEVPCIPINIEPKLKVVSEQLGLTLWENPTMDISSQINKMLDNPEAFLNSSHIDREKIRANFMLEDLKKELIQNFSIPSK